jgi:uncharacterized membrane protein
VNVRRQTLVSAGAIGVMLAVAAAVYGLTPAPFVVSWDMHGQPAGIANRGVALITLPLIAILLTVVFAILPAVAPGSRLKRSGAAWTAVWMAVIGQLLFTQLLLVAANLGFPIDVLRLCALCVAVVQFVAGNWLGKVRRNAIFGLRTPWTLANERVWDRTHRFAGRLMVLGALVLAAISLVLPAGAQSGSLLIATILACACGPALAAVVYSARIAPRHAPR